MASLAQECVTTDCRLTIVDERGLSQLISLPHPGAQCSIIFGTVFEISIFRIQQQYFRLKCLNLLKKITLDFLPADFI